MSTATLSSLAALTASEPKKVSPKISTKPTVVPAASGDGFLMQACEDGGRIGDIRVATVICDRAGEKLLPWGPYDLSVPCGAVARFRAPVLVLVSIGYSNGPMLIIEELECSKDGKDTYTTVMLKGELVLESWQCTCGRKAEGRFHDGKHTLGDGKPCHGTWSSSFTLPEKCKKFERAINVARAKAHCDHCLHVHSY